MTNTQDFQKYINSKLLDWQENDVIAEILAPLSPNAVENIFPVERVFTQNESRKSGKYTRYESQPLASISTRGLGDWKEIADGKAISLEWNLVKISASKKYSFEDIDAIAQFKQKMAMDGVSKVTLDILFSNANVVNPVGILTALKNSEEIVAFYGAAGHSKIDNGTSLDGENIDTAKGLFNETAHLAAPTGNGSTDAEKRLWANKTSEQRLDDIFAAYELMEKTSVQFMAGEYTLLLSIDDYHYFERKYIQEGLTNTLLLDKLKSRNITAIKCSHMNGDNSLQPRSFALFKKNPDILTLKTSVEPFFNSNLQPINGGIEIGRHKYTAGLFIKKPDGVYIGKGI